MYKLITIKKGFTVEIENNNDLKGDAIQRLNNLYTRKQMGNL